MNPRELLLEPIAHIPPARALDGLSIDDAHRRIPGAPHSVAEILAHLTFWQEWFCQRLSGTAAPMVQTAAAGWPAVPEGSWPDVYRRFLEGLERAASFGVPASRLDSLVTPPIEFPPLAQYSVRDAVVHIAQHNAHHLGQVIMLRQLLGSWPPPGGSYTW